ncbi:hypothetical protein [Nonomuraea soli]|uniref:Ribosomal protein S27E n=1 Tax=Nonomuraea soli TaxID=1032476 RepID=A0A7W0CCV7_9ACTN|nr:hypothetical protein [Nonomuraea soli]MBA2888692.1 ribosomal protein S27E [Nonomuraea soli]
MGTDERRRFSDRGHPRQYLSTAGRVLVRCPRCAGCAVVTPTRVTCLSCGYAKDATGIGWPGRIGTLARGRCGTCGRDVERRGSRTGAPPRWMPVRCPGCRAVTRVPVTWWPHAAPGAPAVGGLDLWLQTPCRGHVLWAYDAEHLDFLERYVRAALREREPNRNAGLASRLPGWLKSAKNRHAVLAACATLRKRLLDAGTCTE